MSVRPGQRPRRYSGTPLPETQRRLRPEDILRGFLIGVVILIGGFFLGNFTFSQIAGHGTAYFILAIAVGVVMTAVAYQRLELVMAGFLLIAWLRFGNTPGLANGMTSAGGKGLAFAEVGITFLLFVWGTRSLARGGLPFIRTPLNGLFLAFIGLSILSSVNGALFWDPNVAHFWGPALNGGREPVLETVLEIGLRVLCVGAFWLFANNLQDDVWLRRITWLFLLPSALVVLNYLFHLNIPTQGYTQLLEGVSACTLFAWLLEPVAPGAPDRRGLRRLGWLAFAVIVAFNAVLDLRWVSGALDLYGGLYFVAFLKNKRLFWTMVLAGVVLYFASHAILEATVIHKIKTSGDLFRFSMARASVMYAMKFPLGIGVGNYRTYNAYFGLPSVWNTSTFSSAHGFYSQMLSEMGFAGLILVIAYMLTALGALAHFYRKLPVGWHRTTILGLGGMWAGITLSAALGDYVIPSYHNGGVYTFSSTIYGWIGLGIAYAHARRCGLVSDQPQKADAAAPVPTSADYYPRQLGRDVS